METLNDFFAKNSELSIELSRYVLEHPEMDDFYQEDRVIIFLPEYDEELKKFNLKMAQDIKNEGGKVLCVKVKEIGPKVTSRLVGVEIAETTN